MSASTNDASTRNRSDSTEESELPEHEHKRPRLSDTKPDGAHVMSDLHITTTTADSAAAAAAAASAVDDSPNSGNEETFQSKTPPLPPRSAISTLAMSPTSKVTINTRPLSSQSVTKPLVVADDAEMSPNSPTSTVPTVRDDTTKDDSSASATDPTTVDGPDTVSIPSSPSKSPEIEIAEVEDFDQDPSETRWAGKIGGASAPSTSILPGHVYRTFPYAADHSPGNTQHLVRTISEHFHHTHATDGELFQKVKAWLVDFSTTCETFPPWLYDEDPHFWARLPDLVENLLRREEGAPAEAQTEDLLDFLAAYARIAALIMEFDIVEVRALTEDGSQQSLKSFRLACIPYLQPLIWLTEFRIPFYDALTRTRIFDLTQFLDIVIDRVGDPVKVGLLKAISGLMTELFPLLVKKPELLKPLLQMLNITHHANLALTRPNASSLAHLDDIRNDVAEIVLKADEALQQAIVKQHPWLNLETCSKITDQINLIMSDIAVEVPQIGQEIISTAGVGFVDADLTDLPLTMPHAWKFKTLRKFMTNGRMELRVYGVDAMQNALVQVWNDHIKGQPGPPNHPLVRFLAKFIQENQLVEYIVGVDSHPQLIRRGHNVVGFLCVACVYTDAYTDSIWKTILQSQDPRAVQEVFSLMAHCFNIYSPEALYYICRKLSELPFERFDGHVFQFTTSLLEAIRSHTGFSALRTGHVADPIVRQLCMKLLREAALSENISLEQSALIRREMPSQLTQLLTSGRIDGSMSIGEEEQDQIIGAIAANLKEHNTYASGDLILLNTLISISQSNVTEWVKRYDLAKLLTADLVYLRDQFGLQSPSIKSSEAFEIWYEARTTCLYHLILSAPEELEVDLVEQLWLSLFAAPTLPQSIRAMAWDTLCLVARHTQFRSRVPFLDMILENYLQRLGPLDYSEKLLEFIKISVQYTIRITPQITVNSDDVVIIPGIDRMWKVMLEAPPQTVENEATDFIILRYLDDGYIRQRPDTVIAATHTSLVDRCVQQVISSAATLKSYSEGAASGECEPDVILASQEEIRAEELRFDRSLLFLKKFLAGIKERPRYSPIPAVQPQNLPEFPNKKGAEIILKVQISGSRYVKDDIQKIIIGSDNTLDELWQYIRDASSFSQFMVFHSGQKLSFEGQTTTISESTIPTNLLLVKWIPNTPVIIPHGARRASSPVDSKVMHHFEELYNLLDADERLSREVYGFLSLFPAQTEVVNSIKSMSSDSSTLLPADKPFKLLYSANALRACIEPESFSASPDSQFLLYSVHTILSCLPTLQLHDPDDRLQMTIAHALVEGVLLALRAKVPPAVSREYILNHNEFANQTARLLGFTLKSSRKPSDPPSPVALTKATLDMFSEACLHDDRVWEHVDVEADFSDLLLRAFVYDHRVELRHCLFEVIVGLTGGVGTKLQLKINDPRAPRSRFAAETVENSLSHFWKALVSALPQAAKQVERCSDFYEAMLAIMRRIGKLLSTEELQQYFSTWTDLLLKHSHAEVVGQPLRDYVVTSLTKLLLESCKLLRASNSVPVGQDTIGELFSQFLFPALSDPESMSELLVLPILDTDVRENLYNLVLALCQGPQDVTTIVSRLSDDLLPADFFESHYGHDRQSLRTDVGYAGLRNLSNTCYLNSLFSQLFMNVEFRKFFLNTRFDDENQSLLQEIGKVFAFMQNSYEKSVDPSGAVEAITTYEGEQIDVSIQMDVDEFFNLLFDRLESQIDPAARDYFKSMYGGQLVQQVKSKECEHISERLEPFSAVQVEIKGKARLEDSLAAYVEGEVLQGENKYSCTSCGRHVDAVKRACLKDVPDNLIFNLKRFDYDIMTGTRAKINDEFQFPDTLDIAPYTLGRLSDDLSTEPDIFELTGVIVHSGTAETGHYYSFIRQRPSVKGVQDAWVQFNDQDVTTFDPSGMRDSCFGGSQEAGFYNLPKFFSAYMLFYQRTSGIQKVEQMYKQHDAINPVRVPLPAKLEEHISQQNEVFLRSYCAQDPSHALFVRRVLERMQSGEEGNCSAKHDVESNTLEMVLEYVRQISSRWKETPFFEETIKLLIQSTEQCIECCKLVAHWFTGPRVIEDTIVRNPYQIVRKGFAQLLLSVFTQLHTVKNKLSKTDPDDMTFTRNYKLTMKQVFEQLSKQWELVTRTSRSWTEYFTVLIGLGKLGDEEMNALMDEDFIEKCIDIVMISLNTPNDFPIQRKSKTRYASYLNARDKNRPFNHFILIKLLVTILLKADLKVPDQPCNQSEAEKKIGLTDPESQVLGLSSVPVDFEWLRRLIIGRYNPRAAEHLVGYLAADHKLAGPTSDVLVKGLNDKAIHIAVAFLGPVARFCENCPSENQTVDLAQLALESIATIGLDYTKEYFEFVETLYSVENEKLSVDVGFLEEQVIQTVMHWGPPFLLSPNDASSNVRGASVEFLKKMLFNPMDEAATSDPRQYSLFCGTTRELAIHGAQFAQTTFLNARSRENAALQPGQASQFISVMEHCIRYFDLEDAAHEEQIAAIQDTLRALRGKEEVAVELSPEWQEGSSELAELSEEGFDGSTMDRMDYEMADELDRDPGTVDDEHGSECSDTSSGIGD